MARISELHYSDKYATLQGGTEFVEVALSPGEDPDDFVVSLYNSDGTVGLEIRLTDAGVQSEVDPQTNETVYLLDGGFFDFTLTDPDNGVNTSFEGIALTDTSTATPTLVNFYDIGAGDPQIIAQDGFAADTGAAGTVGSTNIAPPDDNPNSVRYTIQWNQPDPTMAVFIPVTRFDTGVPCFVSGTEIMTPDGPVAVEDLAAGDLVITRDHGAQALQWCGSQTLQGADDTAPITFKAGKFGATKDVQVSPQHRVLVTGWEAELLFGEAEVLVPAKALVDDCNVRQVPCESVTYCHLLFDTHQIVESHGFWSESYYPVAHAGAGWSDATQRELLSIFPQLADVGYGVLARPTLSVQHGRLLRGI